MVEDAIVGHCSLYQALWPSNSWDKVREICVLLSCWLAYCLLDLSELVSLSAFFPFHGSHALDAGGKSRDERIVKA